MRPGQLEAGSPGVGVADDPQGDVGRQHLAKL